MSVFLIGKFYHYDFVLDGRRYKATTGKTSKQAAQRVERDERMRLESGYSEIVQREERAQGRKTIKEAAAAFLVEYRAKHDAVKFAEYALGHVKRLLGSRLVLEVTPGVVKQYQTDRLTEKASPKTINDETAMLLRLCGDQGDLIRSRLRREKALKLKVDESPGKAFTVEEQGRMLAVALESTRQMLSRYSHIRTLAKRRALDEVERERAANRERLAAKAAKKAQAEAEALARPV
jgi:hypothetical protein